jgi:hypothetical protein
VEKGPPYSLYPLKVGFEDSVGCPFFLEILWLTIGIGWSNNSNNTITRSLKADIDTTRNERLRANATTMGDWIPDEETTEMQREEVHALEAIFEGDLELLSSRDGDHEFEFPIVYRIRLNDMDVDAGGTDAESCSDGTTNWPNRPLAVEIRYPKNYPSDEDGDIATTVPSFELVHDNTVLEFPSRVAGKLLAVLNETAQNERGMPSVLSCLYAARDFLDGDREWLDESGGGTLARNDTKASSALDSTSGSSAVPKVDTKYACISTHHLLDHKPDNLLKTGHKCHLSGFYKFGTPGVAVAWGDAEGIEDFLDTLKRAMPQKKFELVFLRLWDGTIPVGWTGVDPPTLRKELETIGSPEEDYYTVLGLEKSQEKSGRSKGKGKGKNK